MKSISDFGKAKNRSDGLRGWCKKCTNVATSQWQRDNPEKVKAKKERFYQNHNGYNKEYYKINADKIKAKTREWYIVNKEKAHESGRLWAISNKEKVQLYRSKWKEANTEAIRVANKEYRIKNKEKRLEYTRNWRIRNIEKAREMGRKASARRLSTSKGKLNSNISREIRASVKDESKNSCHWEDLVNFTVDQLKSHLEKLFQPGMTWENYGTVWEIDHRFPIASFNFEKPEDIEFKLCWSLKNLQPLGVFENRSKSDKIIYDDHPVLSAIGGI
jgi:hypothetical protein